MNKFFTTASLLLYTTIAIAQVPYPPPAAPHRLVRLEYFVDVDPGYGNANSIELNGDVNHMQFDADISGLESGFHRIYIRALDTEGNWGHTYSTFFDNYVVPLYPSQSTFPGIQRLEYFIDVDPGCGNGSEIPLDYQGAEIRQTALIPIPNLTPGVHSLYVRALNAQGDWGLTYFAVFDNSQAMPYPAAPAPAGDIQQLEYFIDTDPGFGNGTPLSFPAGPELVSMSFDIPLNNLSEGVHHIYIRGKQNPWSMTAVTSFQVGAVLPVTWLYVRGELRSGDAIIDWATASEENTDRFIVEHSRDGSVYTEIGTVAAAGNSTSGRSYKYTHSKPGPGMHYYRIRQVDIDGKFSYSKVITLLNRDQMREAVIAPNPVSDMVHLVEPSNRFIEKIEIYDMTGRLMQTKTLAAEFKVVSVNIPSLANGQYLMKVYYKGETKTLNFIKN